MSLILDALRKADSERERESVPGLHTQPMPQLSLEAPAPVRPKRWLWIALGVGVGLLVSLAWYFVGREPARPPVERPLPAPDPVASASAAAPAAAPVAPPNAVVPEPARELAPPAPWPAQERKASGKAASTVATATPAVYAREQLPDNIRAALPPLAVGGSIYSSTPANRSLILDGRLYRENDQLSSDLQLEEIGQKTAVLRFKGYRFEIRY